MAWSNRGTMRLQNNNWSGARDDLRKALQLETANGEKPSALVLNQLGNADEAMGDWELACVRYEQAAAASAEMEGIATANLALALCQLGVCI